MGQASLHERAIRGHNRASGLRHKVRWWPPQLFAQQRGRLFRRAQYHSLPLLLPLLLLLLLLAQALLLVLLLPLLLLLRLPLQVLLQQVQQVRHAAAQDGVPLLRLALCVCG